MHQPNYSGIGPCISCCTRNVQCFCAVRTRSLDASCLYGQTLSANTAVLGNVDVIGSATFHGSVTGIAYPTDLVVNSLEVNGDATITQSLTVDGGFVSNGVAVFYPPIPGASRVGVAGEDLADYVDEAVASGRGATLSAPALVVAGDSDLSGGIVLASSVVISGTAVFAGPIVFSGSAGAAALSLESLSVSGPLTVGGPSSLYGGVQTTSLTASGEVSIGGGLEVEGKLCVDGALMAQSLSVSAAAVVSGLSSLNGGVQTTSLTASGNVYVGGGLSVSGASTFSGTVFVDGPIVISGTSVAYLSVLTLSVSGAAVIGGLSSLNGGPRLRTSQRPVMWQSAGRSL